MIAKNSLGNFYSVAQKNSVFSEKFLENKNAVKLCRGAATRRFDFCKAQFLISPANDILMLPKKLIEYNLFINIPMVNCYRIFKAVKVFAKLFGNSNRAMPAARAADSDNKYTFSLVLIKRY